MIVHNLANGNGLLGRIHAAVKVGQKFCPRGSGGLGTNAFVVPADGLPMSLTGLVRVPETVNTVEFAGSRLVEVR